MPKLIHNGKQKKLCIDNEIDKIIGAITKRSITDKQLASYFCETYYGFSKCHDWIGRTALHVAASCGRTELCQWLINICGANMNAKDLESGYTPLKRALFHGHIHTAVRLIQMGADTSIVDKEGLNAISLVIKDRPKQIKIRPNLPCQVYIWGSNDNYTLGTGTNKSRKLPDLLDNFKRRNVSIKQVCMDEYHSVFVSSCCRVWVCGNGQGGRLGVATERHILTPRILATSGEPCVMAAVALNHTLLLLANGTILACGQNEHYQLGVSPYIKESLNLKPVSFKQQHEQIIGICAGKYHSVFYGKTTLYTCGLNGGQLGHSFSDNSPIIKVPSQVPINLKSGSYISNVASSTACVVFSLSSGDIFVLYQYQFKKIASKQLDVFQIATAGGSLQTKLVNECSGVLKVILLNSGGVIHIWQESVPHLVRCMLGLSRLISISHIFLTEQKILLTSKDGEAFQGTIGQIEKQKINSSQEEKKSGFHKFMEKSECYFISANRIPNIQRAVSITSDSKGKNIAVIQTHPHNSLGDIPVQSTESLAEQYMALLNEATEMDPLHDIVFKVQNVLFAAHEYIISSNSSSLLTIPRNGKIIEIADIPPSIFKEILCFMYSGWCSFFKQGPLCICLPKDKGDPFKLLLESCNKYKITSMYKKLVCFKYENGSIKLKDSSMIPSSEPPLFKRASFPDLYDVEVSSEDGKLFKAHKCILAARLDYFHNMLMGGWLEAVEKPILHLDCPSKTLEVLLDFLYSNEVPESVHSDGFESLARLLVVSDQLLCNDLKEYCEIFLVNCLNLKNAATMLQLSFMYNTNKLKKTVMQFISLNLDAILESRSLEELSDGVLLELSEYHRDFNSNIFDNRIITPFSDFIITDETILSCVNEDWPDHMDEISIKEIKSAKPQYKNVSLNTKSRPTPKKIPALPETSAIKDSEFKTDLEIKNVQFSSLPPGIDDVVFDAFDFPSLDSKDSSVNHIPRNHTKISPEIRKVLPPPRISQKQRKRLSLELDEKQETNVDPVESKPRFKGWALISPSSDNVYRNDQLTSPKVSNFDEIIASEQEERNNLFKLKTKPFVFTQIEDKAMEELYEFYNAANTFDERIRVNRVTSFLVAKPTWIKTNKKLFP